MDAKLSVIIPIYNVEKYLPKCLESIINQTYNNLEIVLIDDGSLDNCPQICDEYALRDNRIKVIHKENGGLASARNAGLEMSTGEYIAFVDSDDWLHPEMYATLINNLIKNDASIAVCDFYLYDGKCIKTDAPNIGCITVLQSLNDFYIHILDPKPVLRFEVWNKIFKRDVIGDVRFKVGQVYEDVYFDRIVFSKATKIVHIDKALYYYRQNRPGNSNSSFSKKRYTVFSEMDNFIVDAKEKGFDNVVSRYYRFAAETAISLHYLASIHGNDKQTKQELVNYFEKYFREGKYHSIRHSIFFISPSLFRLISNAKSIFKTTLFRRRR